MVLKNQVSKFTQAHWLFAFIALIFGGIFIAIIPPLWGLDEPAHFERVYQIAHGSIIPHRNPKDNYGGQAPANLVDLGNYTIGDLVDNTNNTNGNVLSRKDIRDVNGYKIYVDAKFSNEQKPSPGTSSYSPFAYPGPILGVVLANSVNASIGKTLLLARIFSLISYVSVVWVALRLLRNSKIKWLVMVIALMPSVIFQASVISADNILIGLSLLFITLFLKLLKTTKLQNSKNILIAFLGIGIILPLVKINYIFLSLSLFFLPTNLFRNQKISIIIKSVLGFITILSTLFWAYLANATGDTPSTQRPDGLVVSSHVQILSLIHNPLHFITVCARSFVQYGDMYAKTLVSQLGWNYVDPPVFITVMLFLIMFIAMIYAKNDTLMIRKKIILIAGISVVGIFSIFAALYVAFTPVGAVSVEGIQGRYFIPFLAPILLMISYLVPIRLDIKNGIEKYIFGLSMTLCLAIGVLYYALAVY